MEATCSSKMLVMIFQTPSWEYQILKVTLIVQKLISTPCSAVWPRIPDVSKIISYILDEQSSFPNKTSSWATYPHIKWVTRDLSMEIKYEDGNSPPPTAKILNVKSSARLCITYTLYSFSCVITINHFLKYCSDPTTFTDSQSFNKIKGWGKKFKIQWPHIPAPNFKCTIIIMVPQL
jgi:hypothetical protein